MSIGAISLRFWGARGGLPVPGAATSAFGGNTCCVELRYGRNLLILDAGSGLRGLGNALIAGTAPVSAELLLTHTHFDHVCGLPFFAPMYRQGTAIRFWAGHLPRRELVAAALTSVLTAPLMPNLLEALGAPLEIRHFRPGARLSPRPGVAIATAPLRHPGGAVGYRIEAGAHAVAYVTDTEHPASGFDPHVVALARRADVMIYDAYFDEADYPGHVGWGHSTWQHGIELADHLGVGRLVLFHHNIDYDDAKLAAIETAAAKRRPGTLVACEGLCLTL